VPLAARVSAIGLALALAVTAAGLLRTSARQTAPPAVLGEIDIPPIPGNVARALAFGFRSLLADFTLLQAIQVLPVRHGDMSPDQFAPLDRQLYRLLEYSVEVDPKFAGAYRFAAAALPHETMDGKVYGVVHAKGILEKGLRERPDSWHMGFLLGFLQSYYLRDFAAAAHSFAVAAQQRGAPAYIGLLATRLAAQGGELDVATSLAEAMLAQTNEEATRKEWQDRVDALHMERDLRSIEDAARRYRDLKGTFPHSVHALVAAGLLPAVPREPQGGRYLIALDGIARSSASERLHVYGLNSQPEVH
jgi:hypothetical protein